MSGDIEQTPGEANAAKSEAGPEDRAPPGGGPTPPTPGTGPVDLGGGPDLGAWLTDAWKAFAEFPVPWILGALCTVGVGALTLGILAGPLLRGLFLMAKRHEDGESLEAFDVMAGLKGGMPAAVVFILTALTAMLGTLLFVLPGVALAYLWLFAMPAISVGGVGVVDALMQSFRLTTRKLETALLVALLVAGMTLVGGFFVLGWVITLPLAVLLISAAYRHLAAEA